MIKKIFHPALKIWIKLTCYFYFEDIEISGKENLPENCPVIFACNHPNSFLDSLVLTIAGGRDLHYTARGDIFKPGVVSAILGFMNILPVFRREEGKENLHKNNKTFSTILELFKINGAVVIYSEGICENEWDLRPLRKGTARLALEAWNDASIGNKLKVVPVSIQYSSWLKIKPKIWVSFLENIEAKDIVDEKVPVRSFNEKLQAILSRKCIVAEKGDNLVAHNRIIEFVMKNLPDSERKTLELEDKYRKGNAEYKTSYLQFADYISQEDISLYSDHVPFFAVYLISLIHYSVSYLLNFIPYFICKTIAWKSTKGNVYYDSILFSLLLFIYPVYVVGITLLIGYSINSWFSVIIMILTLLSARTFEKARRDVQCYKKRKKIREMTQMLANLS